MSKKSPEKKTEAEVSITPIVKKPRNSAKKVGIEPLLIDVNDIKRGLATAFIERSAEESEKHIKASLEISSHKNGESLGGKNGNSEPENALEDTEEDSLEKIERGLETRAPKKSPKTLGEERRTKIPVTVAKINNEAVKKFEAKFSSGDLDVENAKKAFYLGLAQKIGPVHEKEDEENFKKASQLEEPIAFVKNYRNSLIKDLEKNTGGLDAITLETRIKKAERRIAVLEKVRASFLGEGELTKDEWEEARIVREEVLEKMKGSEGDVEEVNSKSELSQEELSEKEKELYGPFKYIENHRDFLLNLRKMALKKKNPNREKIGELEKNIDGMNDRMELLKKAHEALLHPDTVKLSQNETERVEEIKKEVIERVAEQQAKKEQGGEGVATEEKKTAVPETKVPIKPKPEAKRIIINTSNVSAPEQTEVVEDVAPRPLKTQYEKALERADKRSAQEIPNKKYEIPAIQNENVLSSKEEIASTEKAISSVKTFDELLSIIEKLDGIQGTQKWFSKYALIGRINLVRAKEITPDYIPTSAGLRNKIEELLKADGSLIYKPLGFSNTESKKVSVEKVVAKEEKVSTDEKPTVTEKESEIKIIGSDALKTINNEAIVQEDDFRKGAENIFNERIEAVLAEIAPKRTQYGKQIKIKTQHEHNQTRIVGLMARLFRPSSRKESSNKAEFEKTKKEYNSVVDDLKNVLNDENLNKEAIKMAVEVGERGLEIILEVKLKIFEQLTKTLLKEAQLIEDLKAEGLPEGHKKIKTKLEALAIAYRKKGGKIISERKSEEIIGDNLESHA